MIRSTVILSGVIAFEIAKAIADEVSLQLDATSGASGDSSWNPPTARASPRECLATIAQHREC
jgi:hypothetical protein